jgi:hypothetical protein
MSFPARRHLLLLGVSLAGCALYLGLTYAQIGRLEYPLDDAWIHLTFARNLALRHEFAFVPGQLSAGSTSPLWAFGLAPGFLWPFGPDAWVYTLGVVLLFASAILSYRVAARLFPEAPAIAPVAAIVSALEWHLNWAAFSGMETIAFIALVLLLLDVYLAHRPMWLVGLVGGMCVVTRPESAIMLGLIAAHQLCARPRTAQGNIWRSAGELAQFGVGCLVLIGPYVAFNWVTSGFLFPNTFYAKQAEFADLLAQTPLPVHLFDLLTITFIGAQVLLVPGFLLGIWLIVKERRWDAALLLGWWLAIALVYTVRLPSTFQHGRYEMPMIPGTIILGLWGTWRLRDYVPRGSVQRIVTRAFQIAFALLLVAFWIRGASAIATDAEIMNCMVVETAVWLEANTQPKDVIAVHDIGAAGYFLRDRTLLDLAGLITPDVIPFIRDEPRLMQFILAHQATYLVTSAAWHPQLIVDSHVQPAYVGYCPIVRRAGGYEMGIYRVTP